MKTRTIDYKHKNVDLQGFLAWDESASKPLPGVILCHAWRGRDAFVCDKAAEIASWGYVAFALDLYGKGVLGKTKEENSKLMSPFMEDRKFLQERLLHSLEVFKQQPEVNSSRIASLGFCFGGLCALDFARADVGIKAAVSMHGLLLPAKGFPAKHFSTKVLALHGYDDPMVPPDQVNGFEKEMTAAKTDWQLHIFGNTMHAFTAPEANDPAFGTVYNPIAAKRAWLEVQNFFKETLV